MSVFYFYNAFTLKEVKEKTCLTVTELPNNQYRINYQDDFGIATMRENESIHYINFFSNNPSAILAELNAHFELRIIDEQKLSEFADGSYGDDLDEYLETLKDFYFQDAGLLGDEN